MTEKVIANSKKSNLAINGASPVRDTMLPYGRQTITDEDIEAVVSTFKSDWLTTGPKIEEFENAIAEFVGSKYAVSFSNGTAALHGAYFAAGLKEGDEIITSAMTFAATGNAALYCGAKPVFVDIDPHTGCIDPGKVEAKITSKTRAIVGIDYYGHPCEADRLKEIAKAHDLIFVIDAAHSLGATYNGRRSGTLADMSTFSFHPVKSITTGEGGVVVTDESEFYKKLTAFRTHGIVRDAEQLELKDVGPWYHEMQYLGYNYRITDFQCALGLEQLKRLPDFIKRRREIAAQYRERLIEFSHIAPLKEHEHCQSAYHLFPIMIKKEPGSINRKAVFNALRAENIGVQVHYIPVYQHPYYKQNGYAEAAQCPNTDAFYDREISLPIFASMTNKDVDDVVNALKKIENELLLKV